MTGVAHRDQPLTQTLVGLRIWSQTDGLRDRVHEVFSLGPSRKSYRCSSNKNFKNLFIENGSVSRPPLSTFPPARKAHRPFPDSGLGIGHLPAPELHFDRFLYDQHLALVKYIISQGIEERREPDNC